MTEHFKSFDLQDVFSIFKTTVADDGSFLQVTSKDLCTWSIQEILDSVHFFRISGKIYHIQNLEWSDLFLKQSCDNNLKKKILEYLMNFPYIKKVFHCSSR